MHVNLRKSLFILPNLFTVSGIFCGFYALMLSRAGATDKDLYKASLLIIFAMFFDIIDGRVARLTKTQSAFGMQLDSLADVIAFGVAPAVLVHTWALSSIGPVGLFACFAYVACGAIRLARFNVISTGRDGAPKKPDKYILGLPIPGAAGILVSLIAANHAVDGSLASARSVVLAIVVALAFFMVSTIKFRSFKDLKLNARTVSLVAFAVGSSVILALQIHLVFALGWLLTSYVAIGLAESALALGRRVVRKPPPEEQEEQAAPIRRR